MAGFAPEVQDRSLPLTKLNETQNQIFESACHEGNCARVSILAGARALEAKVR